MALAAGVKFYILEHFVDFLLLLSVNTLHRDRNLPFSVVDSVTKSRRVHDGELQFDAFLLNVHRVFGDFYRLSDSLWARERSRRCFWLELSISIIEDR